jgi:curved DNA-binding protein CbpA
MKQNDAAKILNIDGAITPEAVDRAFRALAMKYHPDRNPAGLDMMKAINAAREVLREFTGNIDNGHTSSTPYAESLSEALNAILHCEGLNVEICGSWIWVSGDTRTHKDALKAAGYRYAPKKKMWNYRPTDWKSASRGRFSMDEIRDRHGSQSINTVHRTALAA